MKSIIFLLVIVMFVNAQNETTIAPVVAPDVATLRPTVPTKSPTMMMVIDPISQPDNSGELDRVIVALSALAYSVILTIFGIWVIHGMGGDDDSGKRKDGGGGPFYSTLKYDY